MGLRQPESIQRSPDGAIFLPERHSPAYANALKAAAAARATAANMQRLAQEYDDLAKVWQVRADEHDAVADHIITRTLGAGALDIAETIE